MNRITVQPGGTDRRVPVENLKGTYFEPGMPREVYLTRYIQRRLADGDLVEVEPAASAAGAASSVAEPLAEHAAEPATVHGEA